MPNIASLLKDEILRLARKEVRQELEGIKKASAHYRSEIAELKRRATALEKAQGRIAKKTQTEEPVQQDEESKSRFSAKRLAARRKSLDISAPQMGVLLGVSAQTIYNWEAGKTRPRAAQMPTIVAMRKMGKKEIAAKLA
jgi:DNA-binding transcriptional regulator YiaG